MQKLLAYKIKIFSWNHFYTLYEHMNKFDKNKRCHEQERRDLDCRISSVSLERRKNPDRRLEGLDVQIIDLSEAAFREFIGQSLYNK